MGLRSGLLITDREALPGVERRTNTPRWSYARRHPRRGCSMQSPCAPLLDERDEVRQPELPHRSTCSHHVSA
jgi:hypothetical protein